MTNIRRYYQTGNVYFLTHVTYNRLPILVENWDLLRAAIDSVKADYPFDCIAEVFLPDHFHMIIDPYEFHLYSIIRKIKLSFSARFRQRNSFQKGRGWQYRFWDHIIRDEDDMVSHIDYVHYNPVKHGLVSSPHEWEHSSIHRFRKSGYYQNDWGAQESIEFRGEFGE